MRSQSLDTEQEMINLALAETTAADDIAALIPDSEPRYSVFNFKHNHEGDSLQSVVFVYSCPGYSCSIKQRLLYVIRCCPPPRLSLSLYTHMPIHVCVD